MAEDAYVKYVKELFSDFGVVRARKMFGGYGIYFDDRMVGLIADSRLYLKVDAQTRPQFEREGCEPFVYDGKGKPMAMSYYSVPDDALDAPTRFKPWARLAYAAALRVKR